MKGDYFQRFEVQGENRFFLRKYDSIWLGAFLEIFEFKFHANLFEFFYFFHNNTIFLLICVTLAFARDPLENEKLILRLLIHHEIFSAYNSNPIFIF